MEPLETKTQKVEPISISQDACLQTELRLRIPAGTSCTPPGGGTTAVRPGPCMFASTLALVPQAGRRLHLQLSRRKKVPAGPGSPLQRPLPPGLAALSVATGRWPTPPPTEPPHLNGKGTFPPSPRSLAFAAGRRGKQLRLELAGPKQRHMLVAWHRGTVPAPRCGFACDLQKALRYVRIIGGRYLSMMVGSLGLPFQARIGSCCVGLDPGAVSIPFGPFSGYARVIRLAAKVHRWSSISPISLQFMLPIQQQEVQQQTRRQQMPFCTLMYCAPCWPGRLAGVATLACSMLPSEHA